MANKTHLTKPPANGLAAVPFVVNAAFGIEVYLKLFHAASSAGRKKKGHSLLSLYDALPQAVKDEIQGLANSHAKHHRIEGPIDFRALVAELNTAFERWRYVYEYSTLGAVNIQPTMLVMHVLHDVAASRVQPTPAQHPEGTKHHARARGRNSSVAMAVHKRIRQAGRTLLAHVRERGHALQRRRSGRGHARGPAKHGIDERLAAPAEHARQPALRVRLEAARSYNPRAPKLGM
jgi:hypothetical protein